MNKKTWYWIGGVVVVVIIILIAVFAGKSASVPSVGSLGGSNVVSAGVARQTLRDLISSGATETCTFSIAATATSSGSTGTIYLASGNMRGDFTTTDPAGKVENAHMILTAGTDYIWTDQMAKGYKVLWSVVASSTAMSDRPGAVNINQQTSYTCLPWVSDQSQFAVPTNIQFTDITALMQQYGPGSANASSTMGASATGVAPATGGSGACARCASVPAAYQAECRAALHC